MQSTKPNKLIGNWITSREEHEIALTMGEKRIGQFDRKDMEDIVDVLAQWRLMLGVTSDTTQEELIFITQFIYDNYKHLTLSDIKMAKTWAIMGRVDVGFVTQKTFSSYYISRSINAYEDEKRRIINEIDTKRERYEMRMAIEKPTPISPEQRMKSFQEHIVTMYQSYHDGNEPYDIGDLVYNWLKEVKLANPNQNEVNEAMIYANEKLREHNYEKNKHLKTKIAFDENMSEENLKKKFARSFIRNKIFDKYPLSTIISKIMIEQFKK
jgi:hypothetical protein